MTTASRTRMGDAARLPRSIRKKIRATKALIWAQVADPAGRKKKMEELYSSLGYSWSAQAKKQSDKRRRLKGQAKAKRIKERRARGVSPSPATPQA